MRILGLDPSLSSFGWAVHDTESAKRPGRCLGRGNFKTSSKTLYVDRYMDLRARVRGVIQEHNPDKVALETPVFGEMYSEGMYGLFLYVSEALRTEGKDVVLWTPPQIKAFARELVNRPEINGKQWVMSKGDMVEAAQWDTRVSDTNYRKRWKNDEADAYLAAVLGGRFWEFHDGLLSEDDLTPRERKQFLEVQQVTRGRKRGREVRKGTLFREDDRFFLWSQE